MTDPADVPSSPFLPPAAPAAPAAPVAVQPPAVFMPPATPVSPVSATNAGIPGSTLIEVAPAAAPKRKRWAFAVGGLAVVGLGVGAAVIASGGSDEAGAAYSLKAAATTASAAQNVAYEMTVEMGDLASVQAGGRLDVENKLMAMDMEMPGLTDGAVSVIFDMGNLVMYMDSSAFPMGSDAPPTKWISLSVGDMPGMEQVIEQNTSANPLDVAKVLDGAKNVEDLGMEDFRGEQVKHYRVTVSMSDALAANPSMQQQMDQLGTDLPDEIVYDAYVTGESQLRRITYEMDIAGQTMKADMVLTAIDDMEPIVVPAADEVTDISTLMGG